MKNDLKNFDLSFISEGVEYIAGIDEAGRGPLAGPVVAAAVIFENDFFIDGVNDSKKISEKKREELYDVILANAVSVKTFFVYQDEIDKINILQATLKAMKQSYRKLKPKPDLVLIDGNKSFNAKTPIVTVVKGDSKSFSVAAASIVAKVTRDRYMREIAKDFPEYNWIKNKGYGTKEHIESIKKYGATPHHRITFLGNIISSS